MPINYSPENYLNIFPMSKLLQKAEAKFHKGKQKEAKEILKRILAKKQKKPQALFWMGTILLTEGNYGKAAQYLSKAVATEEVQPCWYANYANALKKSGSNEAAEKAYKLAELTGCNSMQFYTSYGRFLYTIKGDYQKAELCFAKILEQDANYYSAYIDLGNLYNDMGEYDKTIQCLEACIQLDVKDPVIYSNLGLALTQQGRSEEALKYFRKSIDLSPGYSIAISNYIFAALNVYDNQEQIYQLILELTKELNKNAVTVFNGNLSLDKDRKLRLGFVSGDFYNHAIANFMPPILASINKDKFSIYLYYNNHIEDRLTSAFFKLADSWFNSFNVNTRDFEKKIREDKIDILIDLSNHSKNNRLDVFTRKPAPVQVSLMGLPVSTGLKSIDYSIYTQPVIEQCNLGQNASEKPWAVPWWNWFMHVVKPPEITPPPFLENGYITFGSFNGLRKMNAPLIRAWSEILIKVPESKLRLVISDEKNKTMQSFVHSLFGKNGVDKSRLILVGKMPLKDYMKSHNEVDIALDSYPYNGCTTTYYTLSMGTPLISCRGKSSASQ